MKIILIILISIAFSVNCWSQNLLNQPQKIVIDAERNRYIVSMWGGGGDLVQIDSLGNQSYFVENAGMVDGMQIVGDTVYGSGPFPSGTVRGYNLETGELVMDLNLSGDGVQHLSSFVVDSSGIIYTSERFGTRIFKINPKTQEYWVFAEGNGIEEPNGLLYEPEYNRLLVCLDKLNPPILAISLTDSTVSTVTTTSLEGSDGIAKDKFGNYYITGYELPGIYKFDPDFTGEPELFFEGDYIIYPTYNEEHHSLLITYYYQNNWEEVPLESNILDNPESIVYDSTNNRYLVSNYGDGSVVQINANGTQDYFITGLGKCLGNHITGNTLYVSVKDYSGITGGVGVLGINLTTAQIEFSVAITSATTLDGIASDTSGYLYVIETSGKIFKIAIGSQNYSLYISSGLAAYPQDCIYDEASNRLIVVAAASYAPIQSVNLEDSTISTVVVPPFGSMDGITIDQYRNIYVATHQGGCVYRYDSAFNNSPQLISSGHNGPAGPHYNKRDNILAVPNFYSNSVDLIPVSLSSVEEEKSTLTELFELYQNYPNPFNPVTKIKYEIPQSANASLKVYDVLGNEIVTLINEEKPAGSYQIEFDGVNLPSGIYFYKIQAGNFTETKKMVLMK